MTTTLTPPKNQSSQRRITKNKRYTRSDHGVKKPKGQLMKWVGNKYKFAEQIASIFPEKYNNYFEPFVGTGAVLATVSPEKAYACDTLSPLIHLWRLIQEEPEEVLLFYSKSYESFKKDKKGTYEKTKNRFNKSKHGLDLLMLSRSCYGGVVRFTKEGEMSTPVGVHNLISPESFEKRFWEWRDRVKNVKFIDSSFENLFDMAEEGDLIYCDPPYVDSQKILYGAQSFSLKHLYEKIEEAKNKGVFVVLSIDGIKKSGKNNVKINPPEDLFKREFFVDRGFDMLRRFQMNGDSMEKELVKDRLLLTW